MSSGDGDAALALDLAADPNVTLHDRNSDHKKAEKANTTKRSLGGGVDGGHAPWLRAAGAVAGGRRPVESCGRTEGVSAWSQSSR